MMTDSEVLQHMANADTRHEDDLAHTSPPQVRIAYLYLIRAAERLRGYKCFPALKGVDGSIRAFHYYAERDGTNRSRSLLTSTACCSIFALLPKGTRLTILSFSGKADIRT